MQTRPARADRAAIDLRRLVAGFLRMAPDVAIVGEVRDHEALPLMLTLSSGVKGFTTIHAGSAGQALTRLRFVCQLADIAAELPMAALTSLVSEAVDLVVHCARVGGRPQVTEIVTVEDLQSGPEATAFTVTQVFGRDRAEAPLQWTGDLPIRCQRAFADAGLDVRQVLDAGRPATDGVQDADMSVPRGRPRRRPRGEQVAGRRTTSDAEVPTGRASA